MERDVKNICQGTKMHLLKVSQRLVLVQIILSLALATEVRIVNKT